ncbi:Cullin-domain-containing protein, partial [Rhizoclosmatium globosum]
MDSPSLISLLAHNATGLSYTDMHPAISGNWINVGFILFTFVVQTATDNYSYVDRLWSITPVIFALNYPLVAALRGYAVNARVLVMGILVFLWGARLTFNFWRKGGYNLKDEDYRWAICRKIIPNKVAWHLFSFFFISIYQLVLIYLITLPCKTAFDVVVAGGGEWRIHDTIAVILFLGLLTMETVADQQQWNFQEAKWAMIKAGKKVEELPAPYNVGFIQSGLWRYSRHPNFFAEFSQWWALYLFSVGADGRWWNPECMIGFFLLTLLFTGIAPFTEWITLPKYPLYRLYQKRVSILVPWIPLKTPITLEDKSELESIDSTTCHERRSWRVQRDRLFLAPKKLVIKGFKVKPAVPDSFVADALARLRTAVASIHGRLAVTDSLEELYKSVEHLCVHKQAQTVYQLLQDECASHIEKAVNEIRSLEAPDSLTLLKQLDEAWKVHCRCQLMIRSIFLYLDRTYVIQTPNLKSIWDMGLDLFRSNFLGNSIMVENVEDSLSLKTRVVDAILQTIENERNGQQIPTDLLKSLLQMFVDLGIYITVFEARYLATTESFLVHESAQRLRDMGDGSSSGLAVGAYLEYVEKRVEEEKVRCGGTGGYLSLATKKGAVSIVERVLVESHVSLLLQRGFDNLIQDERVLDLGRMYSLYSRVPNGLSEMKKYFGDYIVKFGLSIVNDVARDPTMIPDLLAFRKKMDSLAVTPFQGNKDFSQAIRDSFEKFINKRANKPAELIAKHVDTLMKAGKGTSEEETEDVLDQCLALFRFIHGKDVFEAFYKKDLAKRLLLGKSSSVDSEKSMFKDIETSKDVVASFRQRKETHMAKPAWHCVLTGYFKKVCDSTVSFVRGASALQRQTHPHIQRDFAFNIDGSKGLDRTLQSLACGKTRVLNKSPKGRDVNPSDSFDFNDAFENPLFRIKVNSIQLKETVEENKDTTEKTRKKLTHTLLIAELFEQLKFPIKAQDLKKRIESLIDREYLEREKNDSSTYVYLA